MTKSISMATAAVLATLTTTSSAMATISSLTSYSSYTVIGDDITITGPETLYGIAGQIQMTTPKGVLDTWCIDVSVYLQNSGSWTIGTLHTGLLGTPVGITKTQLGEMGALIVHGDALVAKPPAGFAQSDVSAAVQIAIWTIENENASVPFTYDPVNAAVTSLTAQYIHDAQDVWAPNTNIVTLASADGLDDNQTQAMAAVPELPSWVMLLIGFAAIGYPVAKSGKSPFGRGTATS
jgi:hypothetical protein